MSKLNSKLEVVRPDILGLRSLLLENKEEYFDVTDRILDVFVQRLDKRDYITSITREKNFVRVEAPYKVKIIVNRNKTKQIELYTTIFLNERKLSLSLAKEDYKVNDFSESFKIKEATEQLILALKVT